MSRVVCIINPAAAGGRAAAAWPGLEARLKRAGLSVEARFTTGPGDGAEQTRQALADGADTVVAVGGDGTIHEVVNGFFAGDLPINPNARLGVLPAGSGSDLVKTLGIPKDADGAVRVLAAGHTRPIDLGRAAFTNHQGQPEARWFVNTASAGLSGAVMQCMDGLPGFLKGAVRYNVASVMTMATYRPPIIQITLDEDEPEDARVLLLVIGNGQFFGGGMHVAPEAKLDDGELDMVAVQARPLPELLLNFPKLYAGTHLNLSMVDHGRGRRVKVDGPPLLVEVDGEQPGRTPAAFEVRAGVLNVIAPR